MNIQANNAIHIKSLFEQDINYQVFDVRTPAEFERGHIPNAINLPLFSNEERAVVGTLYKQMGKESAIAEGLNIVGPRMAKIIEDVQNISMEKPILVYCWRGGMRSKSVAWLLQTAGINAEMAIGGYKAFRNFVLNTFEEKQLHLNVIGGSTGTGKTEIIQKVAENGGQIIDLEKLAHHKGSSFGSIGEAPQPTRQQFENLLALNWQQFETGSTVWIEDESRHIGNCILPIPVYTQLRNEQLYFIKMPVELRAENLVRIYGCYDKQELISATERIHTKLGGLHTKKVIDFIIENRLYDAALLLLKHYYDKTYQYGLNKRDAAKVKVLPVDFSDPQKIAELLLQYSR